MLVILPSVKRMSDAQLVAELLSYQGIVLSKEARRRRNRVAQEIDRRIHV